MSKFKIGDRVRFKDEDGCRGFDPQRAFTDGKPFTVTNDRTKDVFRDSIFRIVNAWPEDFELVKDDSEIKVGDVCYKLSDGEEVIVRYLGPSTVVYGYTKESSDFVSSRFDFLQLHTKEKPKEKLEKYTIITEELLRKLGACEAGIACTKIILETKSNPTILDHLAATFRGYALWLEHRIGKDMPC